MAPEHLLIACMVLIVHENLIEAVTRWDIKSLLAQPEPKVLEPQEVWIDAFDEKICGATEFGPWQTSLSALGCTDGPERAATGTIDQNKPGKVENITSILADLKKFPFFVHYKVIGFQRVINWKAQKYCPGDGSLPLACDGTELLEQFGECVEGRFMCNPNITQENWYDRVPYVSECDGLLVDKNIVLTQERCIRRSIHISSIVLEIGSNSGQTRNSTQSAPVTRRAKKWCLERFNMSFRLATIELDRPVDYVKGRVSPACLRTGQDQHSNDTVCVALFTCPGETLRSVAVMIEDIRPPFGYRTDYRKLDSHLMWNQCYGGGPTVCYDKCHKDERDRVRAFAVGINSAFGREDAELSQTTNLERSRRYLFDLLLMSQKGVSRNHRLKCHVPLEGGTNATGSSGSVRREL